MCVHSYTGSEAPARSHGNIGGQDTKQTSLVFASTDDLKVCVAP